MTTEEKLAEFINKTILVSAGKTVTVGDPLLDSGILDSMAIFQLVSYLENEFEIEVPDEDVVPENFATIREISAFVTSKQHA